MQRDENELYIFREILMWLHRVIFFYAKSQIVRNRIQKPQSTFGERKNSPLLIVLNIYQGKDLLISSKLFLGYNACFQ